MEVFIKKIFFLVILAFHSRGFPGIFDRLSEEMKEHVKALQTLPDEIQTIILQQWFTKGMLQTRQRVRTSSAHRSGVSSIVWNHNGTILTSANWNEGTIKFWQRNGTLSQTLSPNIQGVNSLAWNPAGTLLAAGTWDGRSSICLCALDGTVWKTLLGHAGVVTSLAWNYDGSVLASSGHLHKKIKLWKSSDGTLWRILKAKGYIGSLAWSPDGIILASGSDDGIINLWHTPDGTLVQTLSGHQDGVSSLAWNPAGTILASAGRTIKLWRSDGTLVQTLFDHPDNYIVISITWSPDGTVIASGAYDGTIKLWKPDGTLVKTLLGHTNIASSVAWNYDGTLLASASADGTIKFWKFSQPLLDLQEWNNLTLEQALLLRFLYATPRHALQMLLPKNYEYRESDIDQALKVFSSETRKRLIHHYQLLRIMLVNGKHKEI